MTKKRLKRLYFPLLLALALYGAFTLAPAAVYGAYQLRGSASPSPVSSLAGEGAQGFLESRLLPEASPEGDVFTLYDAATGETFSVTAEEFLPAALACEMDLSAPLEALKAQAVALYTFYSYQRAQNPGGQADFACDSSQWLVYAPRSALEERWGEDFSGRYEKLQEAAAAVEGELLTWEGEPICAAFFAISGGNTESAQTVWGQDLPTLRQAASPGDAFAPGYLSTAALTAGELKAAATAAWGEGLDFSGPEEGWLQEGETTPSGYASSILVGGKAVSGEEARTAFGLRSAWFTWEYEEGVFRFTVRGWGHGVGMSQAGAAFLAEQGADYREILAHYYPGAQLEGAG